MSFQQQQQQSQQRPLASSFRRLQPGVKPSTNDQSLEKGTQQQARSQTAPFVSEPLLPELLPDGFNKQGQEDNACRVITFQLKLLLRQYNCSNEALLHWLQQQGTPVVCIEIGSLAATAALTSMGYQPGFIAPGQRLNQHSINGAEREKSGRFALLINTLSMVGVLNPAQKKQAQQHGLMLLTPQLNKIGFVVHQLFHWMSFKLNLPGYSEKAQKLFYEYYDKNNMETLATALTLPIESLLELRYAIRRELAALCFVREVSQELLAPVHNRYQMIMQGKTLA